MKTSRLIDLAKRHAYQNALLAAILAAPSVWILLTWPPLWRDVDGFNQVASTFAPMGIIHWLPGYCLFGRVILITGGVIGSLASGHGFPYMSLGTPTLNDAGVYALVLFQHLLLVLSLYYLVRSLTSHFRLQIVFALFCGATPWLYAFAQCIGSEAFSNPLLIATVTAGWHCVRQTATDRRKVTLFFGLLVATLLTRQINLVLVTLIPVALFTILALGLLSRRTRAKFGSRYLVLFRRRLFLFSLIGVIALLTFFAVQLGLSFVFRVQYRSTLGRTFEWRLRYLRDLPASERSSLLARVSRELNDRDLSASLVDLDLSLQKGMAWDDLFLLHDLQSRLDVSGIKGQGQRDYLADLKLNRLAKRFLFAPEPSLVQAIKADLLRIRFLTVADLGRGAFDATAVLASFLDQPRYARLRSLSTFQQPAKLLFDRWQHSLYLRLFHDVTFVWLVPIAVAVGLSTLPLANRGTLVGLGYVTALLVMGSLFAVGSFSTTCFDARFLLPTYSCWQIALMLALALLVDAWIVRARAPGWRKLRIGDGQPGNLAELK
jgi:hypothetical protein